MTRDGTEQPELLNLFLRRGELLAETQHAALVGNAKPSEPAELTDLAATHELSRLTQELITRLSSAPLCLRRLSLLEPGDLLERLMQAEPVHPFSPNSAQARVDLADRFALDRRCFVLEYPLLPGHPVNVIWVALLDHLPTSIGQILNPSRTVRDPSGATTAVLYSIWNVEPGMVGIPVGASLLSATIDLLQAEFPALRQILTLSPIPGFRQWLLHQSEEKSSEELLKNCARYLCTLDERERLLDPVARFHIGNGARLLHLHDQADLSEHRVAQSFGIMANYSYEPEDRPAHQRSVQLGNIPISDQIRELLL